MTVIENHYMVVLSVFDGEEMPISVFSETDNRDVLYKRALDKLELDEKERKEIGFIRVDPGLLRPREKEVSIEEKRENEEVAFLEKHDGQTPICLKGKDLAKNSVFAHCYKAGDKFEVYAGGVDEGGEYLGTKNPKELIKEWWVD